MNFQEERERYNEIQTNIKLVTRRIDKFIDENVSSNSNFQDVMIDMKTVLQNIMKPPANSSEFDINIILKHIREFKNNMGMPLPYKIRNVLRCLFKS